MTRTTLDRRQAFGWLAGAAAVAGTVPSFGIGRALAQTAAPAMAPTFTLPPLGYAYEALEPHIDTATMNFHHKNHHNAFITNLNGLVDRVPDLKTKSPVEIVSNLAAVPEAVRTPVRNSMGGHFNHTFFWELMTPGGAKAPTGDLKTAIDGTFGGMDKMVEMFGAAATGRFGSGWAWLAVNKDKKLAIFNTPYQDTPHMDMGAKPVIGLDVWEHAYYLKYQYKRADYVKAWWSVVNWDKAAANFAKALA